MKKQIALMITILLVASNVEAGKGGAIAGGLLGGYVLGNMTARASQPQTVVVQSSDDSSDLRRKLKQTNRTIDKLDSQNSDLQDTVDEQNTIIDEHKDTIKQMKKDHKEKIQQMTKDHKEALKAAKAA